MTTDKNNIFLTFIEHAMGKDHLQKTRTTSTISIGIIAIVAALALLGVVVITALTIPLQQAEARPRTPVKSCDPFGGAYNQSQGRCFNP
jgi:hypothetical protein